VEFIDVRRKELLQASKNALPADTIRPTAWACLWLSDLDKLEELLALAQTMPTVMAFILEGVEVLAKIVPTCWLLALILFHC
jgi:hypothetical protein